MSKSDRFLSVRSTEITVWNNQKLGLFMKPRGAGFEFWKVGTLKGKRTILDHYLTHDDLEKRLAYSKQGDLVWRNADVSELPADKHESAIETEESISRGTFVDMERMCYHFNAIGLLQIDRKTWNAAKKAILGKWTDGIATLSFGPESRLKLDCPLDAKHPLNMGVQIHGQEPDWWGFEYWQLHLMNYEKRSGQRIGVLRVDEQELHVYSEHPDYLAHVLHRA